MNITALLTLQKKTSNKMHQKKIDALINLELRKIAKQLSEKHKKI